MPGLGDTWISLKFRGAAPLGLALSCGAGQGAVGFQLDQKQKVLVPHLLAVEGKCWVAPVMAPVDPTTAPVDPTTAGLMHDRHLFSQFWRL